MIMKDFRCAFEFLAILQVEHKIPSLPASKREIHYHDGSTAKRRCIVRFSTFLSWPLSPRWFPLSDQHKGLPLVYVSFRHQCADQVVDYYLQGRFFLPLQLPEPLLRMRKRAY